jgi:predicted dehydrogenase
MATEERQSLPILVAGLGSIGQRHVRNLEALGVADIRLYRTGRATLPDKGFEAYPVFRDLNEAIERRPAAVVVANPTSLHLPVMLAALQAGMHVLVEKPITHSLDGIDELREAAASSGVTILVGYQFRFHPALRVVRNWLGEGRIGRVIAAHAHWGEYLPGWHPWEDYRLGYAARSDLGGGVLLTLSHPFDYMRWLLGEVAAVRAACGRLSMLDVATEDTALVTLRFRRGALGSVHLNYLQRPPQHTLQIIGEKGTIGWSQADQAATFFSADPDGREVYHPPDGFTRNTLFQDEMEHFLGCVEGRCEPECTLEDGIAALRIAIAAKRSAAEGREVELRDVV